MNPTTFSSTQNLAVRRDDRIFPVVGHSISIESDRSDGRSEKLTTYVLCGGDIMPLNEISGPRHMIGVTPEQWVTIANGGDIAIQLGDNRQSFGGVKHDPAVVEKAGSQFSGVSTAELAKLLGTSPDSDWFKSKIEDLVEAGTIKPVDGEDCEGNETSGYQLSELAL